MSTLWLVGMMGAGKTTVGRLVAASAGAAFIDLDDSIEEDAGRPIPEIFERFGEERFRVLERDAVDRVAGNRAVIATGGGVVTSEGAVERMRETGLVLWLDAPAQTLADRVGDGSYRPMLAGGDPAGAVAAIARERAPAYEVAAHHRLGTAGRDPEEIAAEVRKLWMRS